MIHKSSISHSIVYPANSCGICYAPLNNFRYCVILLTNFDAFLGLSTNTKSFFLNDSSFFEGMET